MDANRLAELRRNRNVTDNDVKTKELVERLNEATLYNPAVLKYKSENEERSVILPDAAYAILDRCLPQAISLSLYKTNQYGNPRNQEMLRIGRIVKQHGDLSSFNDLLNVLFYDDNKTENIMATLRANCQDADVFCERMIAPVENWWSDKAVGKKLISVVNDSLKIIGIDDAYYIPVQHIGNEVDRKALYLLLGIVETANNTPKLESVMPEIKKTLEKDKTNLPTSYIAEAGVAKNTSSSSGAVGQESTLDILSRISAATDSAYEKALGINPIVKKLEEIFMYEELCNFLKNQELWKDDEAHVNRIGALLNGNQSYKGNSSKLLMLATTFALFEEQDYKSLNSRINVKKNFSNSEVTITGGLNHLQSTLFIFEGGTGIIVDSQTGTAISFTTLEYAKCMSLIKLAKSLL